jgi:hypothetical protein
MNKLFAVLLALLFVSFGSAFAGTIVGTESPAEIARIYAPIHEWNKGAALISNGKNKAGEYVYDATTSVTVLLNAQSILLDAKKLNDARIKSNEAGRGDKGSDPDFVATRIVKTLSVIDGYLKVKNYVAPTATVTVKK